MTWQLVIGSTLSALAGCLSLWGMALAWEALPSKAFWAWGLYHGSFPLALLLGGAVFWQTKGCLLYTSFRAEVEAFVGAVADVPEKDLVCPYKS